MSPFLITTLEIVLSAVPASVIVPVIVTVSLSFSARLPEDIVWFLYVNAVPSYVLLVVPDVIVIARLLIVNVPHANVIV